MFNKSPSMQSGRRSILALLLLFLALPLASAADGDSIQFEVPVLPALQKYAELLHVPGLLAVALENNGLSPSMSSKLQIREGGRAVEIRNANLRFVSRKDSNFMFEASVVLNLGVSESKLSFPVSIDLSQVVSGKGVVTISPPLARLFPGELIDRIRIKTQLIANASAQQKILDYLDGLSKSVPVGSSTSALFEPILVDAYNKGTGPSLGVGRDAGDAIPLSDQWMLLITLLVWFVLAPGFLLYRRFRAARVKPG